MADASIPDNIEPNAFSRWDVIMQGKDDVIFSLPDKGPIGDVRKAAQTLLDSAQYIHGIDPHETSHFGQMRALYNGFGAIDRAFTWASRGKFNEKIFSWRLAYELTGILGEIDADRESNTVSAYINHAEKQLEPLITVAKDALKKLNPDNNWDQMRLEAKRRVLADDAT